MRGMKSDEQFKCFLCAHKARSLQTVACVFKVKGRVVRGRKVVFLTVCVKFFLCWLTYGKVKTCYLISSFWNGILPFSDGFPRHETFLDITRFHLLYFGGFFHSSKLEIVSLEDI